MNCQRHTNNLGQRLLGSKAGRSQYFLFALILLLICPPLWAEQEVIEMNAGESEVLKLDFTVEKVATGNAEVAAAVRTADREVLINAAGPGQTNIIVWDKERIRREILINVTSRDATGLAQELEFLLDDIEGIQTRVVGNRVAVEGEVFSKNDFDRIAAVIQENEMVVNLVKMSPLLKQVLTEEIEKAIGNDNVRVISAKDSFLIEGVVATEDEKERAEMIARAYTDNIVNVLKLIPRDSTLSPEERQRLAKTIEQAVGLPQVRVVPADNSFILEGSVESESDKERAEKIALAHAENIINVLKVIPDSSALTLEERVRMAQVIQKAINLDTVMVYSANTSFLLEGYVYTTEERERAEKVAKAYSEDIINVINIVGASHGPAQMTQMTLSIMEITNDALHDLGVHWNPGGSLDADATQQFGDDGDSFSGAITGTISSLFPKMLRLKENGKGRSLFEQTIITKSGEKAHFFVGEEYPIPVAQDTGTITIEYKEVGLTFDVSPTIDRYGNVDTQVDVDSSFITGEGYGGAPLIRDTNFKSAVYIQSNQSIALGGLIGQREARLLSNSPSDSEESLVQLNNQDRADLTKSQVLIFVTPQVLVNNRDAIRDMGDAVKDGFKQYEYENLESK